MRSPQELVEFAARFDQVMYCFELADREQHAVRYDPLTQKTIFTYSSPDESAADIQILAPIVGHRRRKSDQQQETEEKPRPVLIGFRAVYVFDVAQTEGADLPEFEHNLSGDVGSHRDGLIAFLAQQNIALEYSENIAPALGVSYGGKIRSSVRSI